MSVGVEVDESQAVTQVLRAILHQYVPPLVANVDGPAGYSVNVDRDDMPERSGFVVVCA